MKKELQKRQIADFALRTTFEEVGHQNIDQLKKHLLDSLGSLIHATKKPAIQKLVAETKKLDFSSFNSLCILRQHQF